MTSLLRPRPFLPLLSGALLLAAASLAPTAAAFPANLARSEAGARLTLFSSSNAGDPTARAAEALLSEADPLGCALGGGTTTILLSLPRAETLRRFDFLNLTATGRVTVAVSNVALPAESPRWRTMPGAGNVTFGVPDEVVACELGHVEARHLKITFATQTPGRIDTFGLFGAGSNVVTTAVATNAADRPRFIAFQTVPVAGGNDGRPGDGSNFSGATGARVLRVSSGTGAADRIVDGSLGTGHAFAVGDRRPTALVALGARRNITRVSIACRTLTAGRIELYALTRREDVDAPLPPAGRQPDATARVEGGRSGLSRVSLPFTADGARYLAVVFVPDAGGATPAGGGKDFRDYKDARDYKNGGNAAGDDAPGAGDAPGGTSRTPRTGTGTGRTGDDLPPEGPGTMTPPDGSFVLTEVTPTGPLSPTGPGDFSVNSILPPGTASNTFSNPGGNSPTNTPILPPPVGSDLITP